MKSKRWIAASAGILAVAWLLAGCEGSSTNRGITLSPSSVALTNRTGAVTFTAAAVDTNQTLFLPLEWQVSDPSLGRIVSSFGITAVYEGFGGQGNNTVIVKDQSDSEGVALVQQL